jgi:SAM-dependent methyltransferase
MTSRPSLDAFLAWALPMNSSRRMIGRVLKQVSLRPATAAARLNSFNISSFLRYHQSRFHCPVCGKQTRPLYDFPDLALRREHKIGKLRETLQCRKCFAPMRERSLALALLEHWQRRTGVRHSSIAALADAGLGDVRLLDSDNFSAISHILRSDQGYVRSSYLPDHPWGAAVEPNYYNINLERIDFTDASFDIVLTSDVMEHVRNSDAAHAEIHRVLRPGGAYIFNVPFDEREEKDIQLVDTSGDEDVYLCKPQYHGDPLSGGILAYRVFGRELIAKLEALGFQVDFKRIEDPESLVIDGDVFVATKRA